MIQSIVWGYRYSLRRINITDCTMSTDRQSLICPMLQKLKINFCRTQWIDKNPNIVFSKAYHWIGFIILPAKGKSTIIFFFGDRGSQVIASLGIFYPHQGQTHIHNISLCISAHIVIAHSCTSGFVILCYPHTFCISCTSSVIWKCSTVQIIAAKRLIGSYPWLKLHIETVTIVNKLIRVPDLDGLYRSGRTENHSR